MAERRGEVRRGTKETSIEVAVVLDGATLERGLGALPDHRGRRHLAAGLAEHAVVEHDAGDALPAGRRHSEIPSRTVRSG